MSPKKQNICYLKLLNNFCCFFIFTILLSCSSVVKKEVYSDFEKIKLFFAENKIQVKEGLKSILVLSESGCLNCNKSFSLLIEKYINKPNCLILITASGASVDISNFMSDTLINIYFDEREKFRELNIIENSGVIFLNTNGIDTIIKIEADSILNQFNYIESRLSNVNANNPSQRSL